MADPTKDDKTPKAMTLADAAKLVRRKVPVLGDDKKPTGEFKEKALAEGEALSFREYDDKVVVVTTSGEKLEGAKK
jgi:hypothetical protein